MIPRLDKGPFPACALPPVYVLPYIHSHPSFSDRYPGTPLTMLEKRRVRIGGGGGSFGIDNWDAPPLTKAAMAFEIIWFCFVLYLISTLFKVISNVGSRQRQPYILLLVSAILLDISLIMDAIVVRITDTLPESTYLALLSTINLLWFQATVLITMAGLWVFRKRSQLIIYSKGAKGIPYAGQMWKFVLDWVVTSCSLLFLILSSIVYAIGISLYYGAAIDYFDFERFFDAQMGLSYVENAFYFILTIVFVVTGLTLSSTFKRQTGCPDVVRHFLIRLRIGVKSNAGHSSNVDLGHALAHHSYTLHPHRDHYQWHQHKLGQHRIRFFVSHVGGGNCERGMLDWCALWLHQDCC